MANEKLIDTVGLKYYHDNIATAAFQPIDADLTAIAALSGTSGFLKKTAADTWALDTNSYLPLTGGDITYANNGSYGIKVKKSGNAYYTNEINNDGVLVHYNNLGSGVEYSAYYKGNGITLGSYTLSFPTLTANQTIATMNDITTTLGSYLPLSGGTMVNGSTIHWNSYAVENTNYNTGTLDITNGSIELKNETATPKHSITISNKSQPDIVIKSGENDEYLTGMYSTSFFVQYDSSYVSYQRTKIVRRESGSTYNLTLPLKTDTFAVLGDILQSDWNVTDATSKAYILNKPTLGTAAALNTGTSAGNIPVLDSNGKLNSSILPSIALTETYVVSTQADMLALDAQVGDVCVVTTENKTYILATAGASVLNHWQEIVTPSSSGFVTSVNNQTGTVTLTASDVGAVATTASQGLTSTQQSNARANIGAMPDLGWTVATTSQIDAAFGIS